MSVGPGGQAAWLGGTSVWEFVFTSVFGSWEGEWCPGCHDTRAGAALHV